MDADAENEQETEWRYAACRCCTAKWFTQQASLHCPWCGADSPLTTSHTPPWKTPRGQNPSRGQ